MKRLVSAAVVAALLAAGCSAGGESSEPAPTTSTTTTTTTTTSAPATTSTTTTSVAPVEQAVVTRTYVDDDRVTPATALADELPSRTLDVWIDLPPTGESAPLVIFAHGLTGHPRHHAEHRASLASQGFVVAAPAFPLTNEDVEGGFANAGDTSGQVGDVTFLIDSLLADPEIGPRIDASRIGMIGHSLGGLTTAGASLGDDADERISAAVVMSAGFGPPQTDIPVMVLHGDADNVVPFASGSISYQLLQHRRLLVTLVGGDHLAGILDGDSPLGPPVRAITGAFFAYELGTEPVDLEVVSDDAVQIEAATADGPLDDWRDYFTP